MTKRAPRRPASSDASRVVFPEHSAPAPLLPPVRQRTRPAGPPFAEEDPSEAAPGDDKVSGYEVGYRKPPKHSQFRPGYSGNPRGRPRAAKGLNTIVLDALTAKVSVRTVAGDKKMTRMEAVVFKTVELALKGNLRALAQLIALYGAAVPETPTQTVNLPVEDLSATDIAILEELRASWTLHTGVDK